MATSLNPRGHYDYCLNITASIFGTADETVVLFADFECVVVVDCELNGSDLETCVTDVLIDGVSLANGDDLAKRIRSYVMSKADEEIENGGWLWDQVREAEGLSLSGHAGDPDTRWLPAAE